MATKKITITLPEELVEAAHELTDDLPGYAAKAVSFQIRHDLRALDLARYQEEHGPFDPAEIDAIGEEMFGVCAPGQEGVRP